MVKKSCSLFAITVLIFSFSYVPTARAESLEIKKEQLLGIWWVKKNFYTIKADGTYIRELRLRKKKIISSCEGKYTISGNKVSFEGFCPNSKDKFRWEIISIDQDEFKAVNVSFGAQLPEEGVRATKVFKRLD